MIATATETTPAAPALVASVESGWRGRIRILQREDFADEAIRDALRDPDAFMAKARAPELEQRRSLRKRLVGFRRVAIRGKNVRLVVKLYRLKSIKDWFEELLHGKRAMRALRNGLEAERRGIEVPAHLAAAFPVVPERWPARSALAMLALPRRGDAIRALGRKFKGLPRSRRRFLRALGEFCAGLHRDGLLHGDLKAGNVIVLDYKAPRLALIDLDRSRFRAAERRRVGLAEAFDLYRLLQSLRNATTALERRRVLGAYRRALGRDRFKRCTLAFAIAARFAR